MSEKYVAEYVEILDDYGERKGVCVTDTEHTVSFEVKDEYVAMELCDLLNKLYEENEQLRQSITQTEKRINYWQNQYKEVLDKIPPKIKEVWIE